MFLSQRPNNDPAPFHKKDTGIRSDTTVHAYGNWENDPRPGFTQTRDPLPWIDARGIRWADSRVTNVAFSPRHEEFDTPVNPILAEFRHNLRTSPSLGLGLAVGYRRWSEDGSGEPTWTLEEREHARRVLSKIVAVYS